MRLVRSRVSVRGALGERGGEVISPVLSFVKRAAERVASGPRSLA